MAAWLGRVPFLTHWPEAGLLPPPPPPPPATVTNVGGAFENFDRFGSALTAANLDGGSQADLAIGVPEEDVAVAHRDGGVVHMICGWVGGLSATARPDQLWSQDSPNVEGAAESPDRFGSALPG